MISWETPDPLFALTHLDGRNSHKLMMLRPYFSEFAWMKMRLSVMVDYVMAIYTFLEGKKISFVQDFSLADARKITAMETKTNHDLKAIEQFLVFSLQKKKLGFLVPYVNLGIGSEDINSVALAKLLGECRESVLLPCFQKIALSLIVLAQAEKDTIMVARTHAIAANVTTFGKEVANSLLRLCDEIKLFTSLKFSAKCTGEVGSLQGLFAVDGDHDWLSFSDNFIRGSGLVPSHAATQIAPYDSLVRFLQSLERINAILLDFVQNMWLYVLVGYVRVTKVETEVGSAGMPHKINPIYFEGAEGGLETANGMLETLSSTLPVNRLQRDFSDSTTRRSISMPMGLSVLSYQSIVEGIKRLSVDREVIASSLNRHQEVYLESVKAFCFRRGVGDIYDWLKDKTRGKTLNAKELQHLVDEIPIDVHLKDELKTMLTQKNPYPAQIVSEAVRRTKLVLKL
jgi:adenylosuccinate lyase